jgi:hypothetical protein
MRRSKQGPDLRKKRVSDRQRCQLGNIANGRIVSVLGELWVMGELARSWVSATMTKDCLGHSLSLLLGYRFLEPDHKRCRAHNFAVTLHWHFSK